MTDPVRSSGLPPFTRKTPSPAAIAMMHHYEMLFTALYDDMLENVPPCRERSLAITQLEDAAMWLNKGISVLVGE